MPQLKQIREPEQQHVISKRVTRINNNTKEEKHCRINEETSDKKSIVGNKKHKGRRRGKGKFLPLMLDQEKDSTISISTSSSSSSHQQLMFHRRPGFGQLGTKCVVKANHFLTHLADMDLTQYTVSFFFITYITIF